METANPPTALGGGQVRMGCITPTLDANSEATRATPQALVGKLRPRKDRALHSLGFSPSIPLACFNSSLPSPK